MKYQKGKFLLLNRQFVIYHEKESGFSKWESNFFKVLIAAKLNLKTAKFPLWLRPLSVSYLFCTSGKYEYEHPSQAGATSCDQRLQAETLCGALTKFYICKECDSPTERL